MVHLAAGVYGFIGGVFGYSCSHSDCYSNIHHSSSRSDFLHSHFLNIIHTFHHLSVGVIQSVQEFSIINRWFEKVKNVLSFIGPLTIHTFRGTGK